MESSDRTLRRKEYLLARAKCSKDIVRAIELTREINKVRRDRGEEELKEPELPVSRQEEKKEKLFYPCPCGCGAIPEIKMFAPGHDGRVCGWIRSIVKGKRKMEEFRPEIREIYRAWEDSGRPGGDIHPQIKSVIQKIRNNNNE
jgi:hypothetical protein